MTLFIPPLLPFGLGYTLHFQKSEGEGLKTLKPEEKRLLEEIYETIEKLAKQKLSALEMLHETHPHSFEIANALTFAYLKKRKKKRAEALIEKCYHNFPESLIAKINYADQALRRRDRKKFEEIFQGHTDLNTLFPTRKDYYFAEFRGFMVVMGHYALLWGQKEKAREHLELAFQADPLHPSIALLERAIKNACSFRQKLARFFKIS